MKEYLSSFLWKYFWIFLLFLLNGCKFSLQVDNFGTVNLVDACRIAGVNRFILISSILVNGAAMGQIFNPAYIILNVFGLTLVAKLQAEQYIRRSGINYTIVRPGGLRDDPPSGNIVMEPEVHNTHFEPLLVFDIGIV